MTLADLKPGQEGVVQMINGTADLKRRLSALGLVNGVKVTLGHTAPLGDPRAYEVLDYTLSLRNEEARKIVLQGA
ncbi:MAG: ferrous iron transport protein A [Alphaproteobacteria bacterium]|nr:ferrous iron transport protein A [Alphaproteobacteria bacterium]